MKLTRPFAILALLALASCSKPDKAGPSPTPGTEATDVALAGKYTIKSASNPGATAARARAS